MIEINETYIAYISRYNMPYNELESIVNFIEKQNKEEIPKNIKENLEKWKEFLIENL